MAFKITVTNGSNEVLWTYQWATTPEPVNVEDVTVDDAQFKLNLGRYGYAVYSSIVAMTRDPSIVGVTLQGGIHIKLEK